MMDACISAGMPSKTSSASSGCYCDPDTRRGRCAGVSSLRPIVECSGQVAGHSKGPGVLRSNLPAGGQSGERGVQR